MVRSLDSGEVYPFLKDRWAWINLLLDAHQGDTVWYGAAGILPPFLDQSPALALSESDGHIQVAAMSLPFYSRVFDESMKWPFWWRNTKPTHYGLNGDQYIEGSRPRDLPDYRAVSLDIAGLLTTAAGITGIGKYLKLGFSVAIDRYGYLYLVWFPGGQYGVGGILSIAEGYVARTPDQIRLHQTRIPQYEEIRDTITGPCANGELDVIGGLLAADEN